MEWGVFLVNYIVLFMMVLISISFVTLLERKILGCVQYRKGPNKVTVGGFVQPLADGVKLLSKEVLWIYKSNFYYYFLSPCFSFFVMLMCWVVYPFIFNYLNTSIDFLVILMLFSVGVFGVMLSGWSSNSMYSMFGSLRSIAQTISYEVTLAFLLIYQFFLVGGVSLKSVVSFQEGYSFYLYLYLNLTLIFMVILAELNRTPFDLVEGESELVSGFNVEYTSGTFALIFLSEYGMILFFSSLLSEMFCEGGLMGWLIFLSNVYYVILVRGTYPRVRYDHLMYLCWKFILPVTMTLLIVYFSLMCV